MSKVRAFYEALSKDEAMQERAKGLKVTGETTAEAAAEAVIAFAQAEGYAFTAEELKDSSKELSDEELVAVAGGYQCTVAGRFDKCTCFVYGESQGFLCCGIGKAINAIDGTQAFLDVSLYPLWKRY